MNKTSHGKIYWHTLTPEEMQYYRDTHAKINLFAKPAWCSYKNALSPLGCWGLQDGNVKSPADCLTCEFKKGYRYDAIHWAWINNYISKEKNEKGTEFYPQWVIQKL